MGSRKERSADRKRSAETKSDSRSSHINYLEATTRDRGRAMNRATTFDVRLSQSRVHFSQVYLFSIDIEHVDKLKTCNAESISFTGVISAFINLVSNSDMEFRL